MRFITYRIDNQHSFGAVIENRVVDLDRRMKSHDSLLEVIRAGALIRAKDIAAEASADYELKEIEFRPPIPSPGKVICVPVNDHTPPSQSSAGTDFYLRPAESLTGHAAPLVSPEGYPDQLIRPALALVVGSGGWQIEQKHTRNAIAGIALANNGAVHTWQETPSSSDQGTTFPSSAATGPWLVTLDDIEDANELKVACQINDESPRQYSSGLLPRRLPELISYLSQFMQLNPGDLIVVELPESGSELLKDCRVAAGDRISIQSGELGILDNTVMTHADRRGGAE